MTYCAVESATQTAPIARQPIPPSLPMNGLPMNGLQKDALQKDALQKDALQRDSQPIAYPGHALLRAVVESWVDGILILTEQGQWVEVNESARQICGRLLDNQMLEEQAQRQPSHYQANRSRDQASRNPTQGAVRPDTVPRAIWKICQELIQSRQDFPHQPVIVESEIELEDAVLRVRVRWFGVEETDRPYLMVIIEDRHQSNLYRAIAEVDQFRLSPREAEVWLLHRTNHSYKEIAQALYICADTVKKHLKNIRAKQQFAKLI